MVDSKLTGLGVIDAAALSGSEKFYAVQSALSKRPTADQIKTFVLGTPTTFTDPNGSDPAINAGTPLTINYDLSGLANAAPNYSTSVGIDLTQNSKAGQNVYSAQTQAKRTFVPLRLTHNCQAAGQKFNKISLLYAYGMGDSFDEGISVKYAGGPIVGDEGQGFVPVNYLKQQDYLVRRTILSIPAQSSANTTTTQQILQSRTPQAVTVASTVGISINDWVIVGQEIPVGGLNIQAVKITAVGAGTITGIFTGNHISGTTITPALVLNLNADAYDFGEQRVLVNLSGASYSTGTIASPSGGALTGSGTSWANNMVGGGVLNIGAISLTNDDFGGDPFSAGDPCKSWYQIKTVNSTTSIGIHTFSVAQDQAYRGSGTGNYIVRPAARVLRITSNQVVCESSSHVWTVGDTVECAICPYPDVTGFHYRFTAFTPGGTYRAGAIYWNDGPRSFETCINITGSQTGSNYGWGAGLRFRKCDYGLVFDDVKTTAIFFRTAAQGYDNANGTILWDSAFTYLKPDATLGGLKFRPFMGAEAPGAISFKDALVSTDGLYHAEFDAAVISSKYVKPGSFTVSQLGGTTAADQGAGAVVYCSNGNAGVACLAVSNGTNWKVIALGATIS